MLRWLDHQILGPDQEMLGNVDDIQLTLTGNHLVVSALVVGPGGLAQRLPGRLGEWTGAIWRRLHPDRDPRPTTVPLEHVTQLTSAIHLDQTATRDLEAAAGLENWLRRHVISQLPGATSTTSTNDSHDSGDDGDGGSRDHGRAGAHGGEPPSPSGAPETTLRPHPPTPIDTDSLVSDRVVLHVSDFLGAPVTSENGQVVGRICELRCHGTLRVPHPTGPPQPRLQVTHLQYTRHLSGSELGYGADPHQGPALLRTLVRWWQRADRLVPVGDVRLQRTDGQLQITVTNTTTHRHPHQM